MNKERRKYKMIPPGAADPPREPSNPNVDSSDDEDC